MISYLTAEDILRIHAIIIAETTGAHGVRDHAVLLSAEALPQQMISGQELYPSFEEKAAVYIRSIVMNHPFVDGNKRTGMTAAFIFLIDNGIHVTAPEGAIEEFAVRVATQHLDIAAIAAWVAENIAEA